MTEIVIWSNFPQSFMQHFEMFNISQTMGFAISNEFSPNYLNRFSQSTGADFVIRFSLQIEKVNSNTLKSFSMNIQLQWTNGRFNHLILYNKHFIALILLNPHKEGVAAVVIFFFFSSFGFLYPHNIGVKVKPFAS